MATKTVKETQDALLNEINRLIAWEASTKTDKTEEIYRLTQAFSSLGYAASARPWGTTYLNS